MNTGNGHFWRHFGSRQVKGRNDDILTKESKENIDLFALVLLSACVHHHVVVLGPVDWFLV